MFALQLLVFEVGDEWRHLRNQKLRQDDKLQVCKMCCRVPRRPLTASTLHDQIIFFCRGPRAFSLMAFYTHMDNARVKASRNKKPTGVECAPPSGVLHEDTTPTNGVFFDGVLDSLLYRI